MPNPGEGAAGTAAGKGTGQGHAVPVALVLRLQSIPWPGPRHRPALPAAPAARQPGPQHPATSCTNRLPGYYILPC